MLTYTSSHWLTYLTSLESRRSRTKLSSLASRRMRSALPACRIWKLSLKSCGRGETEKSCYLLSSRALLGSRLLSFSIRKEMTCSKSEAYTCKREILKAQSHKSQFHCASSSKIKWVYFLCHCFYVLIYRTLSAFRSERANKLRPH